MAHPKPNFARMMQLIDEVFATRSDPDQLQVTQKQLKKLAKIHPSTLAEVSDENGPVIWVLMIPTTNKVMNEFLSGKVSETGLLEHTKPGDKYESIYLCSATTLPEHRGKGKTKELCIKSIDAIRHDNPVDSLFVWPFTKEGLHLAESIAAECKLQLYTKKH